MSTPFLRITSLATLMVGAAAVSGFSASAAPAAPITTTSTFQVTCLAKPSAWSGPTPGTKLSTVKVTAPPTVAPGESFDVVIDPGSVQIPNSVSGASLERMSRPKIDLPIPANADFVSAAIADPGNMTAGATASVIRVDGSGNPSPSGPFLRVSGDNGTIGNGPNSSTNSHGGLAIDAQSGDTTRIAFPTVRITLKAGASGTIEPKLRTAAGDYGSPESFLTFLPQVSHWLGGTIWAPTYCSPRDSDGGPLNSGAGPLATINVGAAVADTTTTLNVPATAKAGTAVDLTATVVPAGATGTVQFKDGATNIGNAVPVNNGTATLKHTFATNGAHPITAVYSGDAANKASTSAAATVTVSTDPVIVDTTTTVNVPATAKTGTAVDLTATVAPVGATGTVQFKDGAANVGNAVPVNNGTATLKHAFTTDGAHAVTAVYSGDVANKPSTSAAASVNVSSGDNPGGNPGGAGSLGTGSLGS
ncbi:Ig-like domain-containing protein [Rhodococcus oryzae]|uniref:Ig-like domain-containing protein n=1 Tax=Rhodococcus oryzae TaxID=2571143 RepID=UPI00371B3D2C